MKIAITGHTSGIGKALYNRCKEQSLPRHEPIGFSRSNGYDINMLTKTLKQFHTRATDCDVFVNNAHDKFAQVDLLYALWEEWKDEKKHGQGTYTFADEKKYVGGYKDDEYHGQGTFTFADGTVEKGIWENGELVEPN